MTDCNYQDQKLSVILNSCTDCVHILSAMVEVLATRAGLKDVEISRITLAVDELFANIVQHGYGHDAGIVEFEGCWCAKKDGNHELYFIFRDYAPILDDVEKLKSGACYDGKKVSPGGLGMHLIHCVMDVVQYEALENGNRWILVFECDQGVDL